MQKTFYTLLLICLLSGGAFAQKVTYSLVEADRMPVGEQRITPTIWLGWEADTALLQQQLWSAPHESDVPVQQSPLVLTLPDPDGEPVRFHIVAYDMMEPALAAKFPQTRTWRGLAVDNARQHVRLDWTARGFHASVRGDGHDWFVDPYLWNDARYYQSYYTKNYPAKAEPFSCAFDDDTEGLDKTEIDPPTQLKAGDCQFRTYRLAQAATAEYCAYHGADDVGDEALVMAAVTTSINRTNQVYEADLALRVVLIGNTDQLWYYNAATDPYSNGQASTMLGENQTNTDNVIGSAGYDIGHVFGTNSGGVANLFAPCNNNLKARGVTGSSNPVGDPFDIDYVAHEVGHQMGAGHTQNNPCNRSNASSMEPGSASTIMGYAGICAPNVQSNSDAYFHGVSVQQIANYMESGGGNGCATILGVANTAPSVAFIQDRTIPKSTPFVLTAAATDADSDPVTYNWEQWDTEEGTMPPQSTNTQGPMFRSFFATGLPQRYFPRLEDLVTNTDFDWEELPSVGRNMEFRVTVRDYNGTYGCTDEENVNVTVSAGSGPFEVLQPNGSESWGVNSQQTVQWNVANSDLSPVNCVAVDILLSFNGGYAYPVTLASNVPNTGSAVVTMPNFQSNDVRIMVRASDNIFFDISDNNFSLTNAPAASFDLLATPLAHTICEGETTSLDFTIGVNPVNGFAGTVSLSILSVPGSTSGTFTNASIGANGTSTFQLSGVDNLTPGIYTATLVGTSGAIIDEIELQIYVYPAPVQPALAYPPADTVDVLPLVVFDWNEPAAGQTYDIAIATDPDFLDIVISETFLADSDYTALFDAQTSYYWRVRANSDCGSTEWVSATFTTATCETYTSTDVPVTIPNMADSLVAGLTIEEGGTILDVNVLDLQLDHTRVSDLEIGLIAPDSTQVLLFGGLCGNTDNVDVNLDDEAINASFSCPLIGDQTARPDSALSKLDGESMTGLWQLYVKDDQNGQSGSLTNWAVEVCVANFAPLPVTWLDFRAQARDLSAVLDWRVTAEHDNRGFEVQRQTAGRSEFTAIGWVDGRNLDGEQLYSFVDPDVVAGQTYFYRLRQLDYDGREDFSAIRTVRFAAPADWSVEVFPNPAQASLTLRVSHAEVVTDYDLYDPLGRLLFSGRMSEMVQAIDVSHLPQGIYQLHVRAGDQQRVLRVVKQ